MVGAETRPLLGKPKNEDACEASATECGCYIVVADGVGSDGHSDIASRLAVEEFACFASEVCQLQGVSQRRRVARFYEQIRDKLSDTIKQAGLSEGSARTTVIGLIECGDRFILTQLGDGSIYLVVQSPNDGRLKANPFVIATDPKEMDEPPPQIGADGVSQHWQTTTVDKADSFGYMWVIATDGMNDFYDRVGLVSHLVCS